MHRWKEHFEGVHNIEEPPNQPEVERIWNKEQLPEEWKKGLLIKLPKKRDLSNCKNWRGIILLNMASKVFCRSILERIKTPLDEKLREEQAGFRAGRSCQTK